MYTLNPSSPNTRFSVDYAKISFVIIQNPIYKISTIHPIPHLPLTFEIIKLIQLLLLPQYYVLVQVLPLLNQIYRKWRLT